MTSPASEAECQCAAEEADSQRGCHQVATQLDAAGAHPDDGLVCALEVSRNQLSSNTQDFAGIGSRIVC